MRKHIFMSSMSLFFFTFFIIPSVASAQVPPPPPAPPTPPSGPVLVEVTPVPNPTTDTTPNYTFNVNTAGAITYGGSCSSNTTTSVIGDNTITFNALAVGTYSNCTIVVSDSYGQPSNTLEVSSFTIQNEVSNQAPSVSLAVSNNSLEVGDSATLSATASDSDGTITKVEFLNADNSVLVTDVSSPYSTILEFNTVGSYTFRAKATDNDGTTTTSSSVTVTVSAAPNQAPTASFTVSSQSGTVPLTVSFDASDSTDNDGSISSFAWNFGDGTSASGETATHEYDEAGNYSATLTVEDNDGATATATLVISVLEQPNVAPTVNLVLSSASTIPNTPITLTATAADSDGTITNVKFYNSNNLLTTDSSTPYTTTFTPNSDGTYTLRAVATDNDGATATSTKSLSVITPKVAAPTIDPLPGSYNDEVEVSLAVTTPGTTIYYTLDDSNPTESSNRYTDPFTITESGTIKVRAYRTGYTPSVVKSFAFTIVESNPVDLTPPTISNIEVTAKPRGATIVWSTDEAATSQVRYGLIGSLQATEEDSSLVTSHAVELNNLRLCTEYRFTPRSVDAAGNASLPSISTFRTKCPGNAGVRRNKKLEITLDSSQSLSIIEGDANIELQIPEGSYSTPYELQISQLEDGALSDFDSLGSRYNHIAGQVYEVNALQDPETLVESFDEPIDIVLEYNDAEIDDEDRLILKRWHENEWYDMDNCEIDAENNQISCSTNQFSTLVLYEVEESSSSGGGGGSSSRSSTSTSSNSDDTTQEAGLSSSQKATLERLERVLTILKLVSANNPQRSAFIEVLLSKIETVLGRPNPNSFPTNLFTTTNNSDLVTSSADNVPAETASPTVGNDPSGCGITRELSLGMSGQDVSCLQSYLAGTGDFPYNYGNGYYGSVTKQSVESWERRNGLIVDGRW